MVSWQITITLVNGKVFCYKNLSLETQEAIVAALMKKGIPETYTFKNENGEVHSINKRYIVDITVEHEKPV